MKNSYTMPVPTPVSIYTTVSGMQRGSLLMPIDGLPGARYGVAEMV
jgi:hypothetical protein